MIEVTLDKGWIDEGKRREEAKGHFTMHSEEKRRRVGWVEWWT